MVARGVIIPVVKYDGWPIEDLLAEAGRRLREERLNRNMTREQLAELAGVSVETVKSLESDSPNPTLRVVLLVLRALGLGDRFDALFPEPSPSPVQAAVLRRRRRQRASGAAVDGAAESEWEW